MRRVSRERDEARRTAKQRRKDRSLRNESRKLKEQRGEDCSSYEYDTDTDVEGEEVGMGVPSLGAERQEDIGSSSQMVERQDAPFSGIEESSQAEGTASLASGAVGATPQMPAPMTKATFPVVAVATSVPVSLMTTPMSHGMEPTSSSASASGKRRLSLLAAIRGSSVPKHRKMASRYALFRPLAAYLSLSRLVCSDA